MRNPLIVIDDLGGERAEMLFTPHLYAVARERGIALIIKDAKNADEVNDAYLKIAWLAHLNAVDVRKYESGAGMKVADWQMTERGLMDISVWSQREPKRYGEIIGAAVEMITGKTLREIAEEGKKKLMTGTESQSI